MSAADRKTIARGEALNALLYFMTRGRVAQEDVDKIITGYTTAAAQDRAAAEGSGEVSATGGFEFSCLTLEQLDAMLTDTLRAAVQSDAEFIQALASEIALRRRTP